jgi:hypothetical protein
MTSPLGGDGGRETMRLKALYLNNEFIGSVATWGEAARALSVVLQREVRDSEVMSRGNEGPDGFYVRLARLALVSNQDRSR